MKFYKKTHLIATNSIANSEGLDRREGTLYPENLEINFRAQLRDLDQIIWLKK